MGLKACSDDEPGEWGGDRMGIRGAGLDPGGLMGRGWAMGEWAGLRGYLRGADHRGLSEALKAGGWVEM